MRRCRVSSEAPVWQPRLDNLSELLCAVPPLRTLAGAEPERSASNGDVVPNLSLRHSSAPLGLPSGPPGDPGLPEDGDSASWIGCRLARLHSIRLAAWSCWAFSLAWDYWLNYYRGLLLGRASFRWGICMPSFIHTFGLPSYLRGNVCRFLMNAFAIVSSAPEVSHLTVNASFLHLVSFPCNLFFRLPDSSSSSSQNSL